jgi:hypothetical protein
LHAAVTPELLMMSSIPVPVAATQALLLAASCAPTEGRPAEAPLPPPPATTTAAKLAATRPAARKAPGDDKAQPHGLSGGALGASGAAGLVPQEQTALGASLVPQEQTALAASLVPQKQSALATIPGGAVGETVADCKGRAARPAAAASASFGSREAGPSVGPPAHWTGSASPAGAGAGAGANWTQSGSPGGSGAGAGAATTAGLNAKAAPFAAFATLKPQLMEHCQIAGSGLSGAGTVVRLVTGSQQVESAGRMRVDSRHDVVQVRGRFRAIGPRPSLVYFGLHEWTSAGGHDETVTATDARRSGNACRVAGYDAATSKLALMDAPKNWTVACKTALAHQLGLGFYLDGNVHTPAHPPTIVPVGAYTALSCKAPHPGAGWGDAGLVTWMQLAHALPATLAASLRPGLTRVMNHHASSTFNYGGMSGVALDPKAGWVTREFTVAPAPEASLYVDENTFHQHYRPFTDSIALLVLANWTQDAEHELLIADLSISKIHAPTATASEHTTPGPRPRHGAV